MTKVTSKIRFTAKLFRPKATVKADIEGQSEITPISMLGRATPDQVADRVELNGTPVVMNNW